jgi:hypothetical protein
VNRSRAVGQFELQLEDALVQRKVLQLERFGVHAVAAANAQQGDHNSGWQAEHHAHLAQTMLAETTTVE